MTIFAVDNTEFGWDEVVIAAEAWGEWKPFFEIARQSLACLRWAEKRSQMPGAAEMREEATAFRYARNLISGEETRSWLERWDITVDDWMNYLRGRVMRERWADRLKEIAAAHPSPDNEVIDVIKCYAVCEGKLGQWAHKLAGRAAVAARSGLPAAGKPSAALTPRELVDRIETEFEWQRQQTLSQKLIETKIADCRIEWIRVNSRYVWFPEERIAREAAFCVREDGLTLDEVAYDARGIVQQWNFYLDEIDASLRPYFLATRAGDCLGPIKMIEGFPVFSIVAKTMPITSDPNIRQRAERAIVTSFIEHEINERVKWADVLR